MLHASVLNDSFELQLKASNQDALQQATAEYVDAIQKLCAAGLAEMAGIHFLQQAQVWRDIIELDFH